MLDLKTRRIGRFYVRREFFIGLEAGEGTNLFDGMVVLRAEIDVISGRIEYTAVHPEFREIGAGEILPEYSAYFDRVGAVPTWHEVPR